MRGKKNVHNSTDKQQRFVSSTGWSLQEAQKLLAEGRLKNARWFELIPFQLVAADKGYNQRMFRQGKLSLSRYASFAIDESHLKPNNL